MTSQDPVAEPGDGQVVHVDLDASPQAPGQARRAVREVLVAWRLPTLVDNVVLAVSELVTNAVRYGRPPVFLVLRRTRGDVRLDVHDASPCEPPDTRVAAGAQAESGRGLEIVSAVAVAVGVDQVPGDGKTVHASFPVAPLGEDGAAAALSQAVAVEQAGPAAQLD